MTNQTEVNLKELNPIQMWQTLYGRELNCKKNILEYIEVLQKVKKEALEENQWQEVYDYVYESIEKLSSTIKPNTVVQLQKELQSVFRKRVTIIVAKESNEFIEFFKEAYPPGKRRKDFTWVIAEPSKISEEQILQTLKYISNWCTENRLSENQKKDTLEMLERLNKKGSVKYINQVKSLEGLRKVRELSMYIKTMGNTIEKKEKPKPKFKTIKKGDVYEKKRIR
ncbi:MAG: hypothetical protein ACRC1P_04705 [Cellulosilyticaceae bacterium]